MAEWCDRPLSPKGKETIDHDDGSLEDEDGPMSFTTSDQKLDTGRKDAFDSHLLVQGIREPENILPLTPSEPTTVRTFILMVMCRAFVLGKII